MAKKKAQRSKNKRETRRSGKLAHILRKQARLIIGGTAVLGALVAVILLTNPFETPTALDASGVEGKVGPTNDVPGSGPRPGLLAPNFILADYDGNAVRLGDFAGKVVFLNFWATWCTACEAEMPDMNRLAAKYPDDLVVLAVNRGESPGKAERWSTARNLDNIFFVVDSSESISGTYKLPNSMPQSFFIDKDGYVTALARGMQTFFTMEQNFLAALADSP